MFSVAIDGPSGAGKSSISKTVAKQLGFIHIDTGALYRSLALTAIENDVNTDNEISLKKLLNSTKIEITFINGSQAVLLNGENVMGKIKKRNACNAPH